MIGKLWHNFINWLSQRIFGGISGIGNNSKDLQLLHNYDMESDGSYDPNNPSAAPGALQSTLNYYTHGGLTGQQVAENEMSLDNQRRQYAFQVQGMQEAGLNPALMYNNSGGTSAPAAPSASPANMSDLMSMITIPAQLKLMEAQARETDTRADKNAAETENMKLVNQYYPAVTQSQIQKTLTAMGVDDALVQKYLTEVDATEMDIALKEISQVIEQAKADNANGYYSALVRYQNASTEKEKAVAGELAVRAAMETIEKNYMEKYDVKMGSSEYIAIASCICQLLGGDLSEILSYFKENPFVGLTREMAENAKGRKGKGGNTSPTGGNPPASSGNSR